MSEQERYEQATAIFLEARRLPADEQDAYLERRCADDADLRALVRQLLAAEKASVFSSLAEQLAPMHQRLRDQAAGATTLGSRKPGPTAGEEAAGDVIGRFHLLELIGEGGFGRVWVAEQREPVLRRVALKVIKAGMDSKQVVARFEQERQALALMDHPNIAKVLDAGTTSGGRPFFVMELCKGQSISTYCDHHLLSINDRLALFTQVCMAVQHAHTKGVIHRDIKPGNVLVSTHDGRAFAKVIDFGIAKAIDARLTDKTFFTEHRQLIGTPEYMSPEQAEGSLDIDTRTDVYSLGVLLYELLTGSTPHTSAELRSAAFGAMQRIIREVEPPRPSTRLRQQTGRLATLASNRRTAPEKLGSIVHGELDWIVMKALEKDRGRRYESAGSLAADIQRRLKGEAVSAAPPSQTYRLRKFVRRNRAAVMSGAAITMSLLLGLVGFAWQARVAGLERDRAVQAEAQTALRAAELETVSNFQARMLAQVDPQTAGLQLTSQVRAQFEAALAKTGKSVAEADADRAAFMSLWSQINPTDAAVHLIDSAILQPARSTLDRDFRSQPLVDAKLREVLVEQYQQLGQYQEALSLQDEAYATLRVQLGDTHPRTLAALSRLGRLFNWVGQPADAEAVLVVALEGQRASPGAADRAALETQHALSHAIKLQGRAAEASAAGMEVLAGWRRVAGEDAEETIEALGALAEFRRAMGDLPSAEDLMCQTLERLRRTAGDSDLRTLQALSDLGVLYAAQSRHEDAVPYFREVVAGRARLQGSHNPETLQAIDNLSQVLWQSGRRDEAEALQRNNLEAFQKQLGPDHPRTLELMGNRGVRLTAAGRFAEAEPICREVLERRLRVLGRRHPSTLIAYNVMGYVLRSQGRNADAEPFLRQAVEISADVLGKGHPDHLIYLTNMGSLTLSLDRPAEAEAAYREALSLAERALGPSHMTTLSASAYLGNLLLKQNRIADALAVCEAAEPGARAAFAATKPLEWAAFLLRLGRCRREVKEFARAETALLEAYEVSRTSLGPTDKTTLNAARSLLTLYEAWHTAEPAAGHDSKAVTWRETCAALSPPTSAPSSAPSSATSSAATSAPASVLPANAAPR